ncbi:MAG: DUF6057 family protein [Bacteroidales bacterium]|nr:DUF6057 family protein [Bacteroidales bacterium]
MKGPGTVALAAVTFLVFAALISVTDPYAARYLELCGTFFYEPVFIRTQLFQMGGISTLVSSFITQFFAAGWVGTIVCAAMMAGISLLYGSALPAAALVFLLFGTENCFPYMTFFLLCGIAVRCIPGRWRIAGIAVAGAYARLAFAPLFSQVQAPVMLWLPWVLASGAWVAEMAPWIRRHRRVVDAVAAVGVMVLLRWTAVPDEDVFFKRLECNAAQGRWEKTVKVCEVSPSRMDNPFFQNYYHLATAKLGLLTDRMFKFDISDESCLTVPPDRTLPTSIALGEIYWSCGLVARSMRHTFEAGEILGGYSPYLLERLAAENIVMGYDEVARKYVDLLGRTLLYRQRAKKYAAFMDGTGKFPEMERMMKAGRVAEGFCALTHTFEEELRQLLEVYPENRVAQQYLFSELILKRDLEGFKSALDSLWSKGVLPSPLPDGLQRTVVTYGIADWKVMERYGISEKILSELETFASHPERFRETVWYYLFCVSLNKAENR